MKTIIGIRMINDGRDSVRYKIEEKYITQEKKSQKKPDRTGRCMSAVGRMLRCTCIRTGCGKVVTVTGE